MEITWNKHQWELIRARYGTRFWDELLQRNESFTLSFSLLRFYLVLVRTHGPLIFRM
jgi:hypothetical protein